MGTKDPNPYTERRLVALEKDSHPPKPTLDADDAQRVLDGLARRLDAVEAEVRVLKYRDAQR